MYLFYFLILPICFFISGIGCMIASTKKSNKIFGYRTKKSLSNEEIWKYSNHRFGILALRLSVVMCIGNMMFYVLGTYHNCLEGLIALTSIINLLMFVLPIFIVEDESEKMFK